MIRSCGALWIAIILSGCAVQDALNARVDQRDDAYCKQIGAEPMTQAYFNCRLERTRLRALIKAGAAQSAPQYSGGSPLPAQPEAGLGANGQSCLGYTIQTAFGPKFYCQ